MRTEHVRFLIAPVIVLALLCLFGPHLQRAQMQRRTGIDTYAITNARIVTVSGPVIERGTIVIRDGLIAAVGATVSAPPDARLIDGAGLTVYPGIIDANSTLGIPRPTPSPGASPAGGGGFGGPPGTGTGQGNGGAGFDPTARIIERLGLDDTDPAVATAVTACQSILESAFQPTTTTTG